MTRLFFALLVAGCTVAPITKPGPVEMPAPVTSPRPVEKPVKPAPKIQPPECRTLATMRAALARGQAAYAREIRKMECE